MKFRVEGIQTVLDVVEVEDAAEAERAFRTKYPACQGSLIVTVQKESQTYAEKEFAHLLPVDQYGVQVKLTSTAGSTRWMNLDAEVARAFNAFVQTLNLSKEGVPHHE